MSLPKNSLIVKLALVSLVATPALGDDLLTQQFGVTPPRRSTNQGQTLVLQRHTFHDPGSRNMPSHTILVPKDWRAEGQAWWPHQNYFNILPSQDIKVTSPDGLSVYITPSISAVDYRLSQQVQQYGVAPPPQGSSDSGRVVFRRPDTLQEWGQVAESLTLPQTFPQASSVRVTNVIVLPELTEHLNRQLAPIMRQYQMMNNAMADVGMRSSAEAAFLGIEFETHENGQVQEGLFIFSVTSFINDSPTGRQIVWAAEHSLVFRAPKGQLTSAMPTLMSIANSMRRTPEWSRMVTNHAAAMNGIAARGAAERSRIMAESNREISRIINDGYRQRNRIMDDTHRRYINSIREVEDYADGDGTYVQLPSGYDHVYSDGMGNYIMTNDHNFQPNVDLGDTRNWNPIRIMQ